MTARSEREFAVVRTTARQCVLASLRNCLVPQRRVDRVAVLVDVDLVDVWSLEQPTTHVHSVAVDNDDENDDSDSDLSSSSSPWSDKSLLLGDVEAAAWSDAGDVLVLLTTRSVSLLDAATARLVHAHALYFHALDVACFDLRTRCGDACRCASLSGGRDESTAAWLSGLVVAVAGADGLQLFHVCTRRQRFSGRFVVVHEFLNIVRVCVSRDASLLAVISAMGHVGVWRLAGDVGEQRSDNFWFHLVADCERLVDVAFDGAAALLGVTSWDGALRVFERVAGAECDWQQLIPDYLTFVDVKHQAGKIAAPLVALLDDGTALLSSGSTLVQVNLRTAAPVALFQFESAVRGLVADGRWWLCATADGAVRRRSLLSE